jgi:hypothetical protein
MAEEQEKQEEKRTSIAEDALKDLAVTHDGRSDALEVLAAGEEIVPADEPPQEQLEGEVIETGEAVSTIVGEPGQDPPVTLDAAAGDLVAVRKVQAAKFEERSARAQHQQMKKFMIPLLVTVGVLLFLFGGYLLTKLPGQAEAAADGSMLARPWAKFVVLAAFPLGAILMLGAWLFHQDVQRAEKK